jgi:pyruvate/2-oxoglutarate dehydrogenase complex dihydrolipoamide dehydrogenase (E3) component
VLSSRRLTVKETRKVDSMSKPKERWDLIVIGGGTAGIVAAKTAVELGAKVLLIESDRTGGDCLWTGCVPSKALIAVAQKVWAQRGSPAMGIGAAPHELDFLQVMNYVQGVISEIEPTDSIATLRTEGIEIIQGDGKFQDSHTIEVNGISHRFSKAIIATGAGPTVPKILGLEGERYLTSDSLWDLKVLPQRLLILGAGNIGCELGQAFSRIGSQVILLDIAERIILREDADAAKILHETLIREGVDLEVGAEIINFEIEESGSGLVRFTNLSGFHEIKFDRLLVATGRTPRVANLGLKAAGVDLDQRGFVETTTALRTSNSSIYAAGDVTGHPQFTHLAGVHGSVAASNAILGISRRAELVVIPRVTFTDPEIASVGDTSNAVSGREVLFLSNTHVDRAITESRQDGFTKIYIDSKGVIVGAVLVNSRAGEAISELTLAIKNGFKVQAIASVIHPYPTLSDGIWKLAVAEVKARLAQPAIAFGLRTLKATALISAKIRG